MADLSPARGRWAFRPIPPEPRSIVELIRTGTLDAELAAQLWLLIEARVPIVVAAEAHGAPASRPSWAPSSISCRGSASSSSPARPRPSTGCRRPRSSGWPGVARPAPDGEEPVRPETTVLLAHRAVRPHARLHLGRGRAGRGPRRVDRLRPGRDDPRRFARRGLRRASPPAGPPRRRRAVASRRRPRPAPGRWRPSAGRRRPLRPADRARLHGHLQRLGPAVLATWDPADRHLRAFRLGRHARAGRCASVARAGDFEIEVERRRDYLDDLVATGVTGPQPARHGDPGLSAGTGV